MFFFINNWKVLFSDLQNIKNIEVEFLEDTGSHANSTHSKSRISPERRKSFFSNSQIQDQLVIESEKTISKNSGKLFSKKYYFFITTYF